MYVALVLIVFAVMFYISLHVLDGIVYADTKTREGIKYGKKKYEEYKKHKEDK